MPYVQASPRVRAGYAAPLFSALAFLVAAGLSLEASPFQDQGAPVEGCREGCDVAPSLDGVTRVIEPSMVGTYDTLWGVITLEREGTAHGSASGVNVSGTWHAASDAIVFDWGTGSFSATREWWTRSATCEGGSC